MSHLLSVQDLKLPARVEVTQFSIKEGECVVLCGPNGSGKSSLLRVLAGLEPSATGSITLDGASLQHRPRRELAEHLAWLPQRPQLVEAITCEDLVAAARYRFLESESKAREMAIATLENQGIAHLAGRLANKISGGELQRVLIAALVAQDVPFLLVDEPANHLDPAHQIATYKQLGELWRQGKGVLIVSHDVRLARLLGPAKEIRIVGVKDGCLSSETTLDAADLSATLEALYGVEFVPADQPGGLAVELK